MAYRSRLEGDVAVALSRMGHPVNYEEDRFTYITEHVYIPDFHIDAEIGRIYIEVKGQYTSEDRAKTLNVIRSYPDIRLFVALQRPYAKISKKSKTTYAKWCNDYGVPWCPVPIPEDYLNEWLNGSRPTYRARPQSVVVQMPLL